MKAGNKDTFIGLEYRALGLDFVPLLSTWTCFKNVFDSSYTIK